MTSDTADGDPDELLALLRKAAELMPPVNTAHWDDLWEVFFSEAANAPLAQLFEAALEEHFHSIRQSFEAAPDALAQAHILETLVRRPDRLWQLWARLEDHAGRPGSLQRIKQAHPIVCQVISQDEAGY